MPKFIKATVWRGGYAPIHRGEPLEVVFNVDSIRAVISRLPYFRTPDDPETMLLDVGKLVTDAGDYSLTFDEAKRLIETLELTVHAVISDEVSSASSN